MSVPTTGSLAGLVGTWTLSPASAVQAPSPEAGGALQESTAESVFDPDHRCPVDFNDFMDNGKYRSIVKLQMRYKGQSPAQPGWYMGTGWLIRPDLLVTAGHNVFNWSSDLGAAAIIHCHIGYHGKGSIGAPGVQSREARRIVTTAEWIASKDSRNRDFAFIQVDRPFEGNLRLFKYQTTPPYGDEVIGVVGYPGDMTIRDVYDREEKGAMMYEDFQTINYSLQEKSNDLKMLKYRVSTFGGQSGAPVIRKKVSNPSAPYTVIGTHVYGFGDKNQASPIGAINGNDYDAYLTAFSQQLPQAGEIDGISLVKPTATTSGTLSAPLARPYGFSTPNGSGNPYNGAPTTPLKVFTTPAFSTNAALAPQNTTGFSQSGFYPTQNGNAESIFGDIFGAVGSVVSTASSFLGPLGGPVSAIAGAGLQALGKAVSESTLDGAPAAAASSSDELPNGAIERAVLAESTLQAVCRLPPNHPITRKLVDDMKITYTSNTPDIKHIAPKLVPGILHSAYSLAVDRDLVQRKKASGQLYAAEQQPGAEAFICGVQPADDSPFVQALLVESSRAAGSSSGEESFGDFFGGLIKTGISLGKPLLQTGLQTGFNMLNKALSESALAESVVDDPNIKTAEALAKRAFVADAALQAVQKLNKAELQSLKVQSSVSGGQEESFLGSVMDAIKFVAPTVKALGTTAAKAVANQAVDLLQQKVHGWAGAPAGRSESSPDAATATNGAQSRPLRQQRSRINLFDASAAPVQVVA